MDTPTDVKQKAALRDYLAAERTFLAWVRTGLALMGFGFVVARFGLFLQQLQVFQHAAPASSSGLSLWFGTALIAVGVIVNLSSAWHHTRLVRELDQGKSPRGRPLAQNVAIALFLALVGVAMAIYLVSVRGSSSIRSETGEERHMALATSNGIVDRPSHHSVEQTVNRLKSILQSRGVTLRPTTLLIFGSPQAGTPLMLAAPSVAIDLPLKILVWEDHEDTVWISYNSPEYLKERHGLPQELLQNIDVANALATKTAE